MKKIWRCGGLNPGLFACKANTLPLSYIPSVKSALIKEIYLGCPIDGREEILGPYGIRPKKC